MDSPTYLDQRTQQIPEPSSMAKMKLAQYLRNSFAAVPCSIIVIEYWRTVTKTYIAVHSKTTNLLQRKILMRPNLGHIEDIPFVFLGLFEAHQLDVDIPNRIVASLDSLKHVLDHIVRILSGDLGSFFAAEILYPLLRFDVDFGVFK